MIYMLGVLLLVPIVLILVMNGKCPKKLLHFLWSLYLCMPISWLVFGGCPLMMLENRFRAMYDPVHAKQTFTGYWLARGFGIYASPDVIFWVLTLLVITVVAGTFYISKKFESSN